ncbi:MAG: hypothetical protein HCMAGTRE_62 [Candidatus Hodgkinia cicadicola]|nr:MAG: hypothetical protein HCMAGTRE_62 [Candidatus Hodgkinia cicadicola]
MLLIVVFPNHMMLFNWPRCLKKPEYETYEWEENDICYGKRIMVLELITTKHNVVRTLSRVYWHHNCL